MRLYFATTVLGDIDRAQALGLIHERATLVPCGALDEARAFVRATFG
jgi:hypothetical protein